MTFASCANSSDSNSNNSGGDNTSLGNSNNANSGNNNNENSNGNNDNLSSTLPESVGENPVKKTIKLKDDVRSYYSLELKTDGTVLYIDEDDESTEAKFKYTWDEDTKTIRMRLEKISYSDEMQLLTYNEVLSKIKELCTVENLRQSLNNNYDKEKNKDEFKEDYPDCDTYEKYEMVILKENGYKSFDDYVKYLKQDSEKYFKAQFSAQVTYAYKITDSKMTLTEKFTGVKNLLKSRCEFYDSSNDCGAEIDSFWSYVYFWKNDVRYRYGGYPDTDKKTIDFEKSQRSESDKDYETIGNVTATYTENISAGTVTINCEGKEYVCEFEGQKFVQE